MAFPGGHGVFYRRVKGGSLGGERRKYLSDDPAQCGRDMMEQCIGGRLGSFFTQAESMDVTAARLSGTRQFTGRGRGQVGQLLHASKTGMLQQALWGALEPQPEHRPSTPKRKKEAKKVWRKVESSASSSSPGQADQWKV